MRKFGPRFVPSGVLAPFVIGALFFTAVSCAHVGPIASCATELVVQVIQSDLGGSDWEGKTEADIMKYGIGVVDCVVNAIIAEAEHRNGAGAEPVFQHAKAFRAKHADSTKASANTINFGGVSLKSPSNDQVPTGPSGIYIGRDSVKTPLTISAIGQVNVDQNGAISDRAISGGDFLVSDGESLRWVSDGSSVSWIRDPPPARTLEEFMCRRPSCSVEW